jgi:uncharacterized protein YfaS (alpha-2-macroglobulin family)
MPNRSVVAAAVLLAALAAPAQEDEGAQYFSLNSNQAVAPGNPARVMVQTSAAVRQLEFRLYRVKNAAEFWRNLDEENRFGGSPRPRGRPRTWLEKYVDWRARTRGRLRDTVRLQFTPQYRTQIREFLDRPAQPKPRTVPAGQTFAEVPLLNAEQLVRSWRQAIVKKSEWDSVTLDVALADPGVYVLEATNGSRHAYTVLLASNLALVTKAWKGRIAARLVDASTGLPVADTPVLFFDSRERKEIGRVSTNQEGLAELPVNSPAEEGVRLLACREKDCALDHVSGWSLGVDEERNLQGLIYTDRPVYRPGHQVHYRAIALTDPRPVSIQIDNPRGETLHRDSGRFSNYGTVHGALTLPRDAPTGYYGVQIKAGEATIYGGFHVEEYRKPEYEVRVTPAARRVVQGIPARVTLQARYYYGEPVKGATVKYAVRKSRAWIWFDPAWSSEPPGADEDGGGYGSVQVEERQGRLDDDGTLEISLPTALDDHDQRYSIEARVTDSAGREISGTGSLLATRGDYLLMVRPSSYVYNPGEQVRLELRAYYFEGKPAGGFELALALTEQRHERSGTQTGPALRLAANIDATGRGTVEFPAPDSGFYRIEASVKGSRVTAESSLWITGGLRWRGSQQELQVVPDKTSYRAGDTARVLIAGAAPGTPLWVTVEAKTLLWSRFITPQSAAETVEIRVAEDWEPNVFIEALQLRERTLRRGTRMVRVPAERRKIQVALRTSKPQYMPGETAHIELTATGAQGEPVRGEFSLAVVDEPIFAIQPDTTGSLIDHFHGRTWNRVGTGNSLDFYFYGESGRRRMLLAGTRPPGVRGQLKPPPPVQPKVRKLFPDTAFWIANLETGSDGKAAVSFAWPDALTTWRSTARGVASGARVGDAVLRTIVRKNLMLTLATPRFFTEGDQVQVPFIVRNYYETMQAADVSLETKGLKLTRPLPASLQAAAGGEASALALLEVERGDSAQLLGRALAPAESDALELTVPVVPPGVPLSGALNLTGAASGEVRFPSNDNPSTRLLRIQVSPSLAGAIFGALDYLLTFPYGCVEQTMSSLLPNLAVMEAMNQLGIPSPIPPAELARMVEAGLLRLESFQHPDGGWGWWRGDDTHPFLTSYVVLGLQHALKQGFHRAMPALANGKRALASQFDTSKMSDDTRAWQLYALALSGEATRPRLDRVFAMRQSLSPFGLALLGLSLAEAKDARSDDVRSLLANKAIQEGGAVHWRSNHDPMFYYEADYSLEATAFAVRFLASTEPQSPLLPATVRWLVENRNRGMYWDSTKRTALVILGLTPYLQASGELKPDLGVKVVLNGKTLLEKRFGPSDALNPRPASFDVPAVDLQAVNQVRTEISGAGQLYVAANWTSRVPGAQLQLPEGNGLALRREYYRLTPVREGGKVVWNPQPLAGPVSPGDLLGVRLTVEAANARSYLLIEDPLPSGAELVRNEERYEIRGGERLFRSWWTRREERDTHVTFFPTYLPRGQTTYTYLLKVTHAGRFTVSPARVEPMYEPGVVSTTGPFTLEVQP